MAQNIGKQNISTKHWQTLYDPVLVKICFVATFPSSKAMVSTDVLLMWLASDPLCQ